MEEEEAESEESEESDLGVATQDIYHFYLLLLFCFRVGHEGTITPDEDLSQEMGDPSVDITEEMRDKAQEEREQGSIALSDGI